jgi:hypothetical protein
MPRVVPSQVVTLIDKLFQFTSSQQDTPQGRTTLDHNNSNSLAAIVELADQIPPELIALEGDNYTTYVASLAAIRTTIITWQTRGGVQPLSTIQGFGNLNPVTLLRRCLELCPDAFPARSVATLSYISDVDLRENLRIDISTTNQALSNGEWKAATVLAGATVEALLLWALKQKPPTDITNAVNTLLSNQILNANPGADLEKWTLHPLVEVAEELNIIKSSTATQVRLAKDFRNLIHPGKAIRLGQICDRGTALSAAAAIEHVLRDLS